MLGHYETRARKQTTHSLTVTLKNKKKSHLILPRTVDPSEPLLEDWYFGTPKELRASSLMDWEMSWSCSMPPMKSSSAHRGLPSTESSRGEGGWYWVSMSTIVVMGEGWRHSHSSNWRPGTRMQRGETNRGQRGQMETRPGRQRLKSHPDFYICICTKSLHELANMATTSCLCSAGIMFIMFIVFV